MGGAITARKRRNGCSSLLKHVETYMKIHHMRQKHKGIVLSQGMYSYCFKKKNVYKIWTSVFSSHKTGMQDSR